MQARLVEYGITKPQLRKRFTFVNWVRGDTAIDEYYGGDPPGIRGGPIRNRWFLVK